MQRQIGAQYVLPVTGEPIRNGVVTFDETGKVISISAENGFDPNRPGSVEAYGGVLVPGFVNTHSHLELSYMKDALPPGTGLAGFVKRVMESKFTYPEAVQRQAIADADRRLWESGVQAVGDISNTPVSFETKKKSSIVYVTYAEIFDFMARMTTQEAIRQGETLVETARRMGLEAYVTLHSTYSVSDRLFRSWANLNHTECLSIHYRESLADDQLFDRYGPFWEYFREKEFTVDFLQDGSSTNRILHHIPADRRVLLVHNTQVVAEDIERLTARYKKLSWALCSMSNRYIEDKLPPVELLMRYNLNLTVGTDSLSSNTDLSMVAEMRALAEAFHLPLPVVVRWATLNGARALDLDNRLGSFELGKTPGAVLIEGLSNDLSFTRQTTSRRIL
ncbi:MAG: amidohydrolase family protein [Rikenellaceae bacterium]|nr:amidohydrolase family protein [Rikenellaceae bacterium]